MSPYRTFTRHLRRQLPFLGLSVVLFALLSQLHTLTWSQSVEVDQPEIKVEIVPQNSSSNTLKCHEDQVVSSSALESRQPWIGDPKCSKYSISHMLPRCRKPFALASYPGSGNTWIRYLIEGAGGIFTGSLYKDLQIQMYGMWGEIRNWKDGTTIVQKTHDANKHHVLEDFQGRAIVVLRNPYAAILSDHNFLFAGHHGRAPSSHYARKDWPQFVAIQMSRWLDMATNWTHYSDPSQVMVLHYENVKSDVAREMRKVLKFLKLPVNEDRIECMRIHKNGFFQRGSEAHESEAVPFDREVRGRIDSLIGRVSRMLAKGGYEPLPLTRYDYYNKSDAEIIDQIRTRNENREKSSHTELPFVNDDTIDKSHGTKMVLKEYFKWLDSDGKAPQGGGGETEDIKTGLMKQLFRTFRAHSQENTVTGLSEKAEGLLSKAVEIWPMIQKPFQKDPIQDAIETDAFRGQTMEDVVKNAKYI